VQQGSKVLLEVSDLWDPQEYQELLALLVQLGLRVYKVLLVVSDLWGLPEFLVLLDQLARKDSKAQSDPLAQQVLRVYKGSMVLQVRKVLLAALDLWGLWDLLVYLVLKVPQVL
jgi:hypothetical protein